MHKWRDLQFKVESEQQIFFRQYFRAIIFYKFQRGLTQRLCIDALNSIFGDEAPSRTSVYLLYNEFERGRSSN